MHSDSQTALVGELKSALGAQTPLSANLSSLLGSLNSTIKSRSLLIDKLILELAILKRLRFGQSSESSKQIELFGEADSELIIQPAPDPRLELLTPKSSSSPLNAACACRPICRLSAWSSTWPKPIAVMPMAARLSASAKTSRASLQLSQATFLARYRYL